MENLNEYNRRPAWIDTMTKEKQHEWYLQAKKILPRLKNIGDDVSRLNDAIRNYEIRNGIK
jgi:hypothetical protein